MYLLTRLLRQRDSGLLMQIPTCTKGHLYTSPMPFGAYDSRNSLLKLYGQYHINHVFSLVTDKEVREKAKRPLFDEYEKAEIDFSRYIIGDYQAPTREIMTMLVHEAVQCLESRQNILVHCHAGVGRTAVAVCCILIGLEGISGEEAISQVKKNIPIRITSEQIRFIETFQL